VELTIGCRTVIPTTLLWQNPLPSAKPVTAYAAKSSRHLIGFWLKNAKNCGGCREQTKSKMGDGESCQFSELQSPAPVDIEVRYLLKTLRLKLGIRLRRNW